LAVLLRVPLGVAERPVRSRQSRPPRLPSARGNGPGGPARLAARIWLAVRRARPAYCAFPLASGDYALRVTLGGFDAGTDLKAIVDGATAAMQRDEADLVDDAVARLARLLDVDPATLLTLASDRALHSARGQDQDPVPRSTC